MNKTVSSVMLLLFVNLAGVKAKRLVNTARTSVAKMVSCQPESKYIPSGPYT